MVLCDCEPKKIFEFFEEISNIPHGSGNEKEISGYLVKFAKDRGLWVNQDAVLNVVIKKPGTLGYENAPTVILQGHMDMVCEKNKDTVHDFEKDALKLYVDGDFIKAAGTTLGGDNGIAVAIGLALLDSSNISHPPVELLITTKEEVGMDGARELDSSVLEGKILINLDSEEEGVFCTSCAGGLRAILSLPIEHIDWPAGFVPYRLKIKGLKGGHSGIEIHKGRANGNILIARAVKELINSFDLYISEIEGGAKDNAIPREAESILAINEQDISKINAAVLKIEEMFKKEYRASEPSLILSVEKLEAAPQKVYTKEIGQKILSVALLIPNGVQNMSLDIEGLVETSNNLGVISTAKGEIEFTNAVRSSIASRKYYILSQIYNIAELVGAEVEVKGDYPSWEYNPNSYIRRLFCDTYLEMYGKQPQISAIHAGLECGLLAEGLDNPDMISIGPDVFDVHTPEEHLSISSTARIWEFLQAILAKIK